MTALRQTGCRAGGRDGRISYRSMYIGDRDYLFFLIGTQFAGAHTLTRLLARCLTYRFKLAHLMHAVGGGLGGSLYRTAGSELALIGRGGEQMYHSPSKSICLTEEINRSNSRVYSSIFSFFLITITDSISASALIRLYVYYNTYLSKSKAKKSVKTRVEITSSTVIFTILFPASLTFCGKQSTM